MLLLLLLPWMAEAEAGAALDVWFSLFSLLARRLSFNVAMVTGVGVAAAAAELLLLLPFIVLVLVVLLLLLLTADEDAAVVAADPVWLMAALLLVVVVEAAATAAVAGVSLLKNISRLLCN